jgi:NADH:ubiquinone oxidoreductase subunit 6 (subunit J)
LSKAFLVTGVVAGALGMALGIHMGANHDFTLAPAHAHLNLVGFVTLFLAGLFYDNRPEAKGAVATLHYVLATVGAAVLVVGIAGSVTQKPWGEPVAIVGSLITIASMLIFVVQVLRFAGRRA